jgi:hypothetical protein
LSFGVNKPRFSRMLSIDLYEHKNTDNYQYF